MEMFKKTTHKISFTVDMNDPDRLEVDMLNTAHDMVVGKDNDDSIKAMGRLLKPLMSGFCEALRVQKGNGASKQQFLDALVNFSSMVITMAICGGIKPSEQRAVAEVIAKSFTDDLLASVKDSVPDWQSKNKTALENAGAFKDLLENFLTQLKNEKKDKKNG